MHNATELGGDDPGRRPWGLGLDAHECTVGCLEEKIGFDQLPEKRLTGGRIETPEAPGLGRGQSETGHLEKLTLNSPHDILNRSRQLWHVFLLVPPEDRSELLLEADP